MNIQGLIPTVFSPVQGNTASTVRAAATGSGSSGNSSNSPSDLQSTFLNLLVTELQNQDPTSPVDPTQMVTQMVSLNQLDQLISINQTLQNMSSGTATTAGTTPAQRGTPIQSAQSSYGTPPAADPRQAALYQVPAEYLGAPGDPRLMNLYSNPASLPSTAYPIQTGAR